MAAYVPKTLLELWAKSKISVEMVIGHILQRLLDHDERLRAIERKLGHPPEES